MNERCQIILEHRLSSHVNPTQVKSKVVVQVLFPRARGNIPSKKSRTIFHQGNNLLLLCLPFLSGEGGGKEVVSF